MSVLLVCFVFLLAPVQDSTVVSVERLERLEGRVDSLESRVDRFGYIEGYYDSALSSERVWWSTLILVMTGFVGLVGYGQVRREVQGVYDEMEDFREVARSLRDQQYAAIAAIYKSESQFSLDRGDYEKACLNRCRAINKFFQQRRMRGSQPSWMSSQVYIAQSIVSRASEKGVEFSRSGVREIRENIYEAADRVDEVEIEGLDEIEMDVEEEIKSIDDGLSDVGK